MANRWAELKLQPQEQGKAQVSRGEARRQFPASCGHHQSSPAACHRVIVRTLGGDWKDLPNGQVGPESRMYQP